MDIFRGNWTVKTLKIFLSTLRRTRVHVDRQCVSSLSIGTPGVGGDGYVVARTYKILFVSRRAYCRYAKLQFENITVFYNLAYLLEIKFKKKKIQDAFHTPGMCTDEITDQRSTRVR